MLPAAFSPDLFFLGARMYSIPTLSDDVAVVAARQKLAELRTSIAELERERDAGTSAATGVKSLAEQLLDGDAAEAPARTRSEVESDLAIHRQALKLQEQRLSAAEQAASQHIAEDQKPAY